MLVYSTKSEGCHKLLLDRSAEIFIVIKHEITLTLPLASFRAVIKLHGLMRSKNSMQFVMLIARKII